MRCSSLFFGLTCCVLRLLLSGYVALETQRSTFGGPVVEPAVVVLGKYPKTCLSKPLLPPQIVDQGKLEVSRSCYNRAGSKMSKDSQSGRRRELRYCHSAICKESESGLNEAGPEQSLTQEEMRPHL